MPATARPLTGRLSLHRLSVQTESPAWSLDGELTVPGVLRVRSPGIVWLLPCPDTATLLLALAYGRPYAAQGAVLRTAHHDRTGLVALEAAWPDGGQRLAVLPQSRWPVLLAALAGQVADALAGQPDRTLLDLLAPVLAGVNPVPRP